MPLTRREMLTASLCAMPALGALAAAERTPAAGKQKALGVVAYCYGLHAATDRKDHKAGLDDPLTFVEYCRQRGAAGVQLGLGVRDKPYTSRLRNQVESMGMYLEGITRLPQDRKDVDRLTAEAATAKAAGAGVLRSVMLNSRRYETFDTAPAFHKWQEQAYRSLTLAEPAFARLGLRLAIENHKDLRTGEFLPLLKRLGSAHVGICVDFGNNLALLEDPLEVVEAYAPLAFSTHVKDMAVAEYEDGFLLAEVRLGQGILDLPKMFAVLRRAQPDIHFNLEMLTRDPLKVPCLTPKYWVTSETLPARYLARTLATVRRHKPARPLVRISELSPRERLAVEEDNVLRSLSFAAKRLL
jgi:sugar phosphate isomerase/epimerase